MLDVLRPLRVLALSIAFLAAFAASASAAGPGGWSNLGAQAGAPSVPALDGRVDVLNTDMPGKLIAGGAFLGAGQPAGNTVFDDHIAIWDGTSWSPLRNAAGAATDGLNGDVRTIAVSGSKIYAGGVFTNAGGNGTADFLAVWDTSAVTPSWQPICPSSPNGGTVTALQIVGSTMYVGGSFGDWGGAGPNARDFLISCDLNTGVSSPMVLADGDATGGISSLAVDGNGDLYAGGSFSNWGTIATADDVVKYDLPTNTMSGLGGFTDSGNVDSLTATGTDLYVGTDHQDVGGLQNADSVAKWNGSSWVALGSNTGNTNGYFGGLSFNPDVQALTTSGSTVYASGNWINANADPLSDDVASFNGASWNHVGSNGALNDGPFNANLNRGLAVYNGNLIAGGNFSDAGGEPLADSIACFQLTATPCTPPIVTPPPPATPTPPAAGPTGRRAAALKKCKKKSGDARTACKKKAKKLPV
jgi:trimeric autotransporter adhesin